MSITGTVKFFNANKGYGFLTREDGGDDVFVHITAVNASGLDTLAENDKVSFDTEPSKKKGQGPVAVNIKVLN